MSTVQLESLLQFIQSLSLSAQNKKWLAEHLISDEEETLQQKNVSQSLSKALRETKSALAAGKSMPNAFDLLNEL